MDNRTKYIYLNEDGTIKSTVCGVTPHEVGRFCIAESPAFDETGKRRNFDTSSWDELPKDDLLQFSSKDIAIAIRDNNREILDAFVSKHELD